MIPDIAIKTYELRIQRTIPASPAETFDGWLDKSNPGTPWCEAEADEVILDPKVGKLFFFARSKDDGRRFPHYGRFTAVERPHRVSYTWMSPFTRGLESVVTVTFQKKGDDTLLTLTHANLPDDELGHLHEGGWKQLLDAITEGFVPKHA
jgi:uncharacterized protein YndB with AHSA1/START domain